jgi:hypothetical protein
MVASGCTVAACWHVTLALLVVVASVRHVHPYRHCSNVKHVHLGNLCARAPWEHTSLKCTAEPAATSFIFEARGPQRAARHVVGPKSSPTGRRVWSCRIRGSAGALRSREAGLELRDTW